MLKFVIPKTDKKRALLAAPPLVSAPVVVSVVDVVRGEVLLQEGVLFLSSFRRLGRLLGLLLVLRCWGPGLAGQAQLSASAISKSFVQLLNK